MLTRAAERWQSQPDNPDHLAVLSAALDLARELPFEANLWAAQNAFFDLRGQVWAEKLAAATAGDAAAREWVAGFVALGEKLGIDVTGLRNQIKW